MKQHYALTIFILFLSSVFEMIGTYGFWAWMKEGKSPLLLIPGMIFLGLFAYVMITIESEYAGKLYALSAGVYLITSMGWMWLIEGNSPDKFDSIGMASYLFGSTMIFYGEKIFA